VKDFAWLELRDFAIRNVHQGHRTTGGKAMSGKRLALAAALSALALGDIGSVAQADTFTSRIAAGQISSNRN
jgi:hypothetical protein